MDVKTELKELKSILIGYIGKQKVDLVMNTDQIDKSIESPDKRKVDFTAKVDQTHVTPDKENEIIEKLPPEVEIQTNNEGLPDAAVTETIEITGKKVNSIILELKATPGILHSVETFKAAILKLVQVMQTAGGIDVDIEDTVTVNLKFESPITEDQFAVVKCLLENESNGDNDTKQLLDECSFISDEYLSTADVEEIESPSELDINSQTETSEVVKPESTEAFTEPSCKYCDNKDRIIRILEEKQNKSLKMFESPIIHKREENRELIRPVKGTSLVSPLPFDFGMISNTKKLGLNQKESKSDDFISLASEQTYGLHDNDSKMIDLLRQTHIDEPGILRVTEKLRMPQKDLKSHEISIFEPQQTHYLSSKTVDECRNCYEKDEIIIQLDRRLCEIRRRVIEAKKQSVSGNNFLEDLLQFIHQHTNMTSVEEKEGMNYKELNSVTSSQKSELISDFDVRDLETKANMKLMDLQSSQGPRPVLDQTEEKNDLSLRISEIRREYARNSYTKTDAQKGLGIIIHRNSTKYFPHFGVLDPDTQHLQQFFEEIGFVSKCIAGMDYDKLLTYMTDDNFYCIFMVIKGYKRFSDHSVFKKLILLTKSQGKPVILMTDSTSNLYYISEITEDIEILIAMPSDSRRGPYGCLGDKSLVDDFIKVTRRNRFDDIMDILTRINGLNDRPSIAINSTLKKKFFFL